MPEVVGAEAFENVRAHVERSLRGEAARFDGVVPYRLHGERYMEISYTPDVGEDGRVRGIVSVAVDATARHKAESRLAESGAPFRPLADNIPHLAWMADRTGSIFWYNRRWYEYTGTTPEDM